METPNEDMTHPLFDKELSDRIWGSTVSRIDLKYNFHKKLRNGCIAATLIMGGGLISMADRAFTLPKPLGIALGAAEVLTTGAAIGETINAHLYKR